MADLVVVEPVDLVESEEVDDHPLLVADLERAADLGQAVWAPNTQRVYQGALRRWEAWCRERRVSPLPAKAAHIVAYLGYLVAQGLSRTTLDIAMVVINHAHVVAGYGSPKAHPDVRYRIQAFRRQVGAAQRQAPPLLPPIIRKACERFPETLRGLRDRAALTVGFGGALRRSELVALNRGDVEFDPRGLIISIRRSKTDQDGVGVRLALPRGKHTSTCPVRNLEAWLDAVGDGDARDPLWLVVYGAQGDALTDQRMSVQAVNRLAKRAAAVAGLDEWEDYSGHSLRAGFVTAAARAGRPAHVIKRQTRHKGTAMVERYIREANLFLDSPGEGLL